jgi:UDP-N-acetylglucosamine 2-epimerase (non-hydrolysing)
MSFKIMMVFGTRPEAIKMAPLARILRQWPGVELSICSTGQHREMLKQVALEGGTVLLVGTDTDLIVTHSSQLLDDAETYKRMSRAHSPYGDGQVSERISRRLCSWLSERLASTQA